MIYTYIYIYNDIYIYIMAFMFYNCSLDAIAACHHDHWPSSRTPRWTAHRPWKRHKIHGVMERTAYLLCLYKTIQNLYNSRQDILLSISLLNILQDSMDLNGLPACFPSRYFKWPRRKPHDHGWPMPYPSVATCPCSCRTGQSRPPPASHPRNWGTEGPQCRPGLPRSGRCTGDRKKKSKEKKGLQG